MEEINDNTGGVATDTITDGGAATTDLFTDFFNAGDETIYEQTPGDEIDRYMRVASTNRADVGMKYWIGAGGSDYPHLKKVAVRTLSVPATSAPIERVFSHSGIIMRPHRASMAPALLEQLVFLKCNRL